MPDLRQRSINIILDNQASSGAYIASPNMANYAYSWFRDGTFIAYAMDGVGEHNSAQRFYIWCATVINARSDVVERALLKTARGEPLSADDYLHTRYALDGRDGTDASWPNFQLDGLGTWLWGVQKHLQATGRTTLPDTWARAVDLTVRYLTGLWQAPNYDCWEEFNEYIHPHTLAAIYAGLRAAAALDEANKRHITGIAADIRRFVLMNGCRNGRLVKSFTTQIAMQAEPNVQQSVSHEHGELTMITNAVDASLICVATPYNLLSPTHPIMQATLEQIETDLHRPGGGVYRYLGDTYYGGGEWVLLAAWLGWHYALNGKVKQARELLHWVETQADIDGNLPEQVSSHLLAPERYAEWETRWGVVANPLLWSHAMYLLLYETLRSIE